MTDQFVVPPEATVQEVAKNILECQNLYLGLQKERKDVQKKIDDARERQSIYLAALRTRIGNDGLVKVDGEVMHVHNKWLKPIQIHE